MSTGSRTCWPKASPPPGPASCGSSRASGWTPPPDSARTGGARTAPDRARLRCGSCWSGGRLFDTKLVELTEYGFAAITRLKVDDALLAEVERLGWRLVIGSGTEFAGLAEAYQHASSLRNRVLTSRRSVRADDVTWSVAGLLGPRPAPCWRAACWHPCSPSSRSAATACSASCGPGWARTEAGTPRQRPRDCIETASAGRSASSLSCWALTSTRPRPARNSGSPCSTWPSLDRPTPATAGPASGAPAAAAVRRPASAGQTPQER